MSSRRRSRSRERKAIATKLRMDANAPPTRITDPSLPAGRRREIDNVMKKARAHNSPSSSALWEKKLLEVEAKDSNRWRHSGYKSMYLDGGSTSRSRSRSRSFSSTRRGGGGGGGSPSPPPPQRRGVGRSPRGRSPRSPPPRARSPRSPPPRGRSPRSPPPARRGGAPISPPSGYRGRPKTPPSPRSKRCIRRSASASSLSSCSDDSCSVCSPKHRPGGRSRSRSYSPPPRPSASNSGPRGKPAPPAKPSSSRPRPPSPASPPPPRRMPRPMTPPMLKRMPMPMPRPGGADDRPTDPRTRPPPPRPQVPLKKQAEKGQGGKPPVLGRIKKEGAARKKARPGSPGNESSGSEDSGGVSSAVPIVATTAMTLSERFGKIAQWSADRERRDIENMRITKTGSNMKVMVEEDEFLYGTPPRRYSISPVPQGHYPDELLSAGQSRTAAWDDVRVRYQYYKDLGYLRDLSLDDYVKWEEWWYKYQDWLANERHYEHWLSTHSEGGRGGGGRRRKKRIPASQRLGN